MIPPKIKALFQFIEYLHSKIENFNLNNDLIKETDYLIAQRRKLSPKKTYKDKLKHDEVQAAIESKFNALQENTAEPIKAKAMELGVCDFKNAPIYNFNAIETEISQLKDCFHEADLLEIFKHKQLYIEYRKSTHRTFLSLGLFFDELDEIAKSLFDYFNEKEQSDFEGLETKTKQVNDIGEAVKLLQQGEFQKFVLPNSYLNPATDKQQPNTEILLPQPGIKQKAELNEKLITFKNSESIEKIHSELKGYFLNKEAELLKVLQGERLNEMLLFPHNQNKFVEVFRRLRYNGFILDTDTQTKKWICSTFQFLKRGFAEPQPFNESSVWGVLNKGKGEPPKRERICNTEWLPYKSHLQLKREEEKEKI